jgi:hypothetical protein
MMVTFAMNFYPIIGTMRREVIAGVLTGVVTKSEEIILTIKTIQDLLETGNLKRVFCIMLE